MFARFRPLALSAALALAPVAAGAETREIVHYQKNMAFNLDDIRPLLRDIRARAPDTVSLQEVSPRNRAILARLAREYPAQHFCQFPEIGGVAVLSRWPLIGGTERCLKGRGITAMRVQMPEGPVWVMSVHVETPDKPLHGEMTKALAPDLAATLGPMILGGDFNALPLSTAVREIAGAAGVERIGTAPSTYYLFGAIGLPIDHVLATGGRGTLEVLPFLGSDHKGLLARFKMRF